MSLIFYLKPHYPRKVRARMELPASRAKRKKRIYKILKTTTYPTAEEINYFDDAQLFALRREQERAFEAQRREDEEITLLEMMGAYE